MGNTTEYIYDSANRLIKTIKDFDTHTVYLYGMVELKKYVDRYSEQAYIYDPCGNKIYEATKVTDDKWKYTVYSYDALSRMVCEYKRQGKVLCLRFKND